MRDYVKNRLAARLFLSNTIPAVLIVLIFVGAIFLVALPAFRESLMNGKRQTLRKLTETAKSVLVQYYEEERSGSLSREVAQERAKISIGKLRFGDQDEGVFWICDADARILLHPFQPDRQGRDIQDFMPPIGKLVIREIMRKRGEDKGGWVELAWKGEGFTDPGDISLSYVRSGPWDWLLGTDMSMAVIQGEIAPVVVRLKYVSMAILAILLLISLYGVRHGLRGEYQRQKAENTVRQTRNYLQNILDGMPSLVVGVDTDKRVTLLNAEAQRLCGMSSEEAMGRLLWDVLPYMADQKEKLALALESGEPSEIMKVPRLVEGETRYLDIMIYPVLTAGSEGAVIRVDDVTSHARMEDMMVQTEKMMSVGGLAAGMAHEINNPLGGILQGSQNIIRRLSPELAKNAEEAEACGTDLETIRAYLEKRSILKFIEGIRSSCERAAKIVSNMLEFSRRSESTMTAVDMVGLLEDVVELASNDYDLKKRYDFRHIEIVREFEDGLPLVFCEKTRIEQVVLNLLRNAAQAMEAAPVEEQTPRIFLRLNRDDGRMRVEIEDNGPGMDEKTRKRAFEPFFTTKEVGVGTGLGLSVSYFIITENHQGSMELESSPGNGAKFTILLPIDRRAS